MSDGKFGCRRSIMYSAIHFLFGSYSPLPRLRIPRVLRCQKQWKRRRWRLINEPIDRHNDQWPATIKQNKADAVLSVCLCRYSPRLLCRKWTKQAYSGLPRVSLADATRIWLMISNVVSAHSWRTSFPALPWSTARSILWLSHLFDHIMWWHSNY